MKKIICLIFGHWFSNWECKLAKKSGLFYFVRKCFVCDKSEFRVLG